MKSVLVKIMLKRIIGGPFVSKARANESQKTNTNILFRCSRINSTENAHSVVKNNKVESTTETLARIGTRIEVLKISRAVNESCLPKSFVPPKKISA